MAEKLKIHTKVESVWNFTKNLAQIKPADISDERLNTLKKSISLIQKNLEKTIDNPKWQVEQAICFLCIRIKKQLEKAKKEDIQPIKILDDKSIKINIKKLSNLFEQEVQESKIRFPSSINTTKAKLEAIRSLEIEVDSEDSNHLVNIQIASAYIEKTLMSNKILNENEKPEKIRQILQLIETLSSPSKIFYTIEDEEKTKMLINQELSTLINNKLAEFLPAAENSKSRILRSTFEWLNMAKGEAYKISLAEQKKLLTDLLSMYPWDIDELIRTIKDSRKNDYHHPEIEPIISCLRDKQILFSRLYHSTGHMKTYAVNNKDDTAPEKYHINETKIIPGWRVDFKDNNFLMSNIILAGKYESGIQRVLNESRARKSSDPSIKIINEILLEILESIHKKMIIFAKDIEKNRDKFILVRSVNYSKQYNDTVDEASSKTNYSAVIQEAAAHSDLKYLSDEKNRKNVLKQIHSNDVEAMSVYVETIVLIIEAKLGKPLSQLSEQFKKTQKIDFESVKFNAEKLYPRNIIVIRNYLSKHSTILALQKKGKPQLETHLSLLDLERVSNSFQHLYKKKKNA